MNWRNRISSLGSSAVLAAALLAPPATAEEAPFSLPAAIPGDVFLCMAQRPNPEREFLDAHWAQVWEAFQDSGVTEEVFATLGTFLSEDQQEEVDRVMEHLTTLHQGVDWDQLGAVEFAFGERMPQEMHPQVGMMPEMVWLFRGTAEGSAKNFDGLVAILDGIAEEVNLLSGGELLAVARSEQLDAQVASLGSPAVPELPISLEVALAGDVIAIGWGETLLHESLALLAGKSDKLSKAADPRFVSAREMMARAEDSVTFFDMQTMLGDMRSMVDGILVQVSQEAAGPPARDGSMSPEAVQLNNEAIEAYQSGDYATALQKIREAHEVEPEDAVIMYSLACLNALNGNREEALDWLERCVEGGFANVELLRSDSDLDSLRADPRYDAALAKAKGAGGDDRETWLAMVGEIADRIQEVPGMIDYVVGIEYTEGYSTHSESLTAMTPDAESKPFYPVFAGREKLTAFDRYLPAETTSFSVSSGIDFGALYDFLEDSVGAFGPEGEQILEQWAMLQEEWELDVRRDVFGWIEGQTVSVTLGTGMQASEVMFVKVNDEELAREKVHAGIEFLGVLAEQMVKESGNPMLGMIVPQMGDLQDERLEGFHTLVVAGQPMVWGVADGQLILGSGADPVVLCLQTAIGEHPSVRENEELMSRLLLPPREFSTLSYADERGLGETIADVLNGLSMLGMAVPMIPDEDARLLAARGISILRKLAPVAQEIDFYISTSSYDTFDGNGWHTHSVTYYLPPIEEQKGEAR